jgi:anti-sigma factor RsiW
MNKRDLELLSSYLDGQLSPSDYARLESRLSSDPDLRAVLDDLRGARSLLRGLPTRKAPRNFTLTPKMVGKNPPLPRSYPAFQFMTALATLMLFFTVGLNFLAPQLTAQAPIYGMGGGGGEVESFAAEEAPAPAATEAPAEEPSVQLAPLPTATLAPAGDTARAAETPSQEDGLTAESLSQNEIGVKSEPPFQVPSIWQILLGGVALLGVIVMVLMRQLAVNRWRRK